MEPMAKNEKRRAAVGRRGSASLKPKELRKSTKGVGTPVADMSNWRKKLRADIKFDYPLKLRFLEEMLRHGKRMLAAATCDISMQTVRDHIKIDPDFATLFDEVLQERADRVTRQLEEEALAGFKEPIFDREGNKVGEKQVYETPLRLAMLRRYDPEYKDRSEVVHGGVVGVLIAPAQLSPQQWMAQETERNAHRVEPDKNNLDAPAQIVDASTKEVKSG